MAVLSVLDIAPVLQGSGIPRSLLNTRDLARHVERLGYHRYWLAEHHGLAAVASAATAVVVGHVAASTSSIRVGAGGIMLPNHAPLVIAEQFGTLDALFPHRIDLGVGRAAGSDPVIAQALRRGHSNADAFPQDVAELLSYLRAARPGQAVQAVPGEGSNVPVWILGSSMYGARLAAAFGLPYAFAFHFSAAQMDDAIAAYRREFKPSEYLKKPYLMLSVSIVAADTDAEARLLSTTMAQVVVGMYRGNLGRVPPPIPGYLEQLDPMARMSVSQFMGGAIIGGPATVERELAIFLARSDADELIVTEQIFDHAARLRSYEIVARLHEAPAAATRMAIV